MLNKKTNLSTYLTNDANAAAIGEMQFGGAKNMKNFIFITLGTGLGSGFVAGGELIYGSTGFAGELGHTIIYQGGRKCGCGRLGCLETYCSATGIARTVQKKLFIDKRHSILRNINIDLIDSKSIYEAALFNDEIALEAFEYTGKILGLILANAVAVTSPEAIFLFGGLALAGDLIFKPTEYWMNYYMLNIFKNTVKLLPSQLPDNDAAILGAAAMVWKNEQK